MHLVTANTTDGPVAAVRVHGGYLALPGIGLPASVREFIAAGDAAWANVLEYFNSNPDPVPDFAEDVPLAAPVPDPINIIGIGLNYLDHCREQGIEPPAQPVLFAKFRNSVTGPGAVVEWDTRLTKQVDYEAELAVVIGRRCRGLSEEDALACVFGYMNANDLSARDLQFGDRQWVRGKSLDGFCPMGPYLVTADEVPDPQALPIRCTVNGRVLQDSSTSEMIAGVARLVSFCSQAFTLEPGDVILTGTPDGVGFARKPPIFLNDGDEVVVEVGSLGRLVNWMRAL